MGADQKRTGAVKVRKHKRVRAFEDNRELMRLAKASSKSAIESLLESGISVVYLKDGQLVRKAPDKSISIVSDNAREEAFDLREYLCQG